MNRSVASLLLFCAISFFAPRPASAVTIPTVPVGNAGNANDPSDGASTAPGVQNFGAVAYEYRIGVFEVTNAEYVEFLNAKAASDPLALYNANMGSEARGGITRTGSGTIPDPYAYTTKTNMGNKPVNWVSWYDSIRFANWLNNGQGTGDTETGAYTILGNTPTPSNGLSIIRNPGSTWFLTSEDEWYKGAYHQPSAQGGDTDDYWLYPTASNSAPTIATANAVGDISNPGANVANYLSADWNSQNGNVTTVGTAGPLSQGFYGTSDQCGNVWEWNELSIGSSRGIRGGSFLSGIEPDVLRSSSRYSANPTDENVIFGFRVATVPEPSTLLLAAVGLIGLAAWGWRRRR
jgi:formylglycine-generating enzyme required for sulfatase activity